MTRHLDVRRGVYHDSVALMQVSHTVGDLPEVDAALVAMGTELNLELLAGMGFEAPDDAGPSDLLIAIDAADDALPSALARAEAALTERARPAAGGFGDEPSPRTIGSAAERIDASLALVSTPGRYAFLDAMDALEAGLPVVVFSDNVPVEQEVALKQRAAETGLLVMGPDCGTAVVGGVGLGFANVVRPGSVGIVAASGTGAQQVMTLLDAAGLGVSHCLGVGGRDMSGEVGGRSTHTALELLDGDKATELILVVGKPPAPEVAEALRAQAKALTTPVRFALLDADHPDLTAATADAAATVGGDLSAPRRWDQPDRPTSRGHLRGLFSGGTLCDEAMLIASTRLGPVRSNIPLHPEWALPQDLHDAGHLMIDFGDDELTQGRPHPMIDGAMRTERLREESADPDCGVLLLDIVLGHGAHPDPAAELAPAITAAIDEARRDGRALGVVISLIGTGDDPQGLERQAAALHAAGASVHLSNADATRTAVALVGGTR